MKCAAGEKESALFEGLEGGKGGMKSISLKITNLFVLVSEIFRNTCFHEAIRLPITTHHALAPIPSGFSLPPLPPFFSSDDTSFI